MGASADVGAGLIIVHLVGKAFGQNIPYHFYPIGVFLSLMPDIDFIWAALRGEATIGHRKLPHLPVIMIGSFGLILGALSIFASIFWYWFVVSVLCLLGHFIDDSIGSPIGIKWLSPFRERYYVFWPPLSLSEEEAKEKIEKLAVSDDVAEIIRIFLRPTTRMIGNIAVLVVAIFVISFW